MNARQAAMLGVLAIGAGFVFGLLWGAATREQLPAATRAEFNGGVLTVRVDASQAAGNALESLFQ